MPWPHYYPSPRRLQDTQSRRHPGLYNEAQQAMLSRLQQENYSLNQEINDTIAERERARYEVRRLQTRNNTLSQLLKQRESAEKQAIDYGNRYYGYFQGNQAEIQLLKDQSKAGERKLEECMGELRKMQLSSFQQAQTTWPPEEDGTVRELIASLYKSVRAWASTYSVESLSDIQGTDHRDLTDLLEDMQAVTTITNVDDLVEFEYPFLILAALLSEHLYDYISNNPFFAFNNPEEQDSEKALSTGLNQFFKSIPKR